MDMKKSVLLVGATGLLSLLAGCGVDAPEANVPAEEGEGRVSEAVYTDHAIVTCQSATLFGNYTPGSGGSSPRYTMYYGNKVGIRRDAGDGYMAMVLDYGPNVWGYVLRGCLTPCAGPNNPIAGCF
jgi:hypothetical protein